MGTRSSSLTDNNCSPFSRYCCRHSPSCWLLIVIGRIVNGESAFSTTSSSSAVHLPSNTKKPFFPRSSVESLTKAPRCGRHRHTAWESWLNVAASPTPTPFVSHFLSLFKSSTILHPETKPTSTPRKIVLP